MNGPRSIGRFRRVTRMAACLAVAGALTASPIARAHAWDDEPGERLGLSAINEPSGSLLGFLRSDRLKHQRSLSFGFATSTGSSNYRQSGAAYTDFFSYRLRDNLTMDLALQYSFTSSYRSAQEERGEFSVLPSFALEYHPSQNTFLRVSYERLGPGSPFAMGRRFTRY